MTVLKRPCSADTSVPDAKIRKIVGCDQGGHMYECSRYVWWDKRAHCFTEQDRKFSSKRMALLYLAKMNSASLEDFLKETGKQWADVCSDTGVYALSPNVPFDFDEFLELPDEVLEDYGKEVGNTLNVRKAPRGTIYRYQAVALATTEVQELCQILES